MWQELSKEDYIEKEMAGVRDFIFAIYVCASFILIRENLLEGLKKRIASATSLISSVITVFCCLFRFQGSIGHISEKCYQFPENNIIRINGIGIGWIYGPNGQKAWKPKEWLNQGK